MIRLLVLPIVILGVLLVVRWTSWAESRVFYHPSRDTAEAPVGAEDVNFMTADGVRLHGWLLTPVRAPHAGDEPARYPVVLHCHGNAGNIGSHLDFSSFLVDHGIAVFIFDYRGYGKSQDVGSLDRGMLMKDTEAALATLLARPEIDSRRVGVMGVSLGAVFATAIAREHPESVRAVCTVSAFASWARIANDHLPIAGPILLSNSLSPARSLRDMAPRPVLLVHGDRDEIIGFHHLKLMEDAARAGGSAVTAHVVKNGDHNGVLFTGQGEQEAIADFFATALAPR